MKTFIGLKFSAPTIYEYRQAIATLASCCLALSGGLTHGISAVLLPQLKHDPTFPYDQTYDSWIASSIALSMAVGCLCTGLTLDIFGRKASHIIWNIPFIIGWLFIAVANNNGLILVGRFFTGISSGAYRPVTMVYIGEISDPKFRSVALIIPSLMTSFGVLLSHVMGKYLYWRTTIYICLIPPITSLVMYMFLRESPLWLISKGKVEEGTDTFKWFRGIGEMAEKELIAALEKQKENVTRLTVKGFLQLFTSTSFVKPFLVVILIMFCLNANGVNVLLFYALDFYDVMFSNQISGFTMMIAADCLRVFVIISVCVFSRVFSKRKAFLMSCFGVVIMLSGVIACLYTKPSGFSWVPISCMLIYTALGSAIVMWGWTFVPEILPNKTRGIGSSLASIIGFIFMFIFVKVTPDIVAAYGHIAIFAAFAISTLIAGVLLIFVVPETKGKTLQAIEDSYEKKERSRI